jgi:hypothetical protein
VTFFIAIIMVMRSDPATARGTRMTNSDQRPQKQQEPAKVTHDQYVQDPSSAFKMAREGRDVVVTGEGGRRIVIAARCPSPSSWDDV